MSDKLYGAIIGRVKTSKGYVYRLMIIPSSIFEKFMQSNKTVDLDEKSLIKLVLSNNITVINAAVTSTGIFSLEQGSLVRLDYVKGGVRPFVILAKYTNEQGDVFGYLICNFKGQLFRVKKRSFNYNRANCSISKR